VATPRGIPAVLSEGRRGVIHGYSGAYQDKIPYNSTGFAPAIVPSAAYCWGRYCSEVVLLGFNALMITVGATLP
jgi:hypothetical protein